MMTPLEWWSASLADAQYLTAVSVGALFMAAFLTGAMLARL